MKPRFAPAGWVCRAAILISLFFFCTPAQVFANSITILRNDAQLLYHRILFTLKAENSSPIERAVLIHGVKAKTCQNSQARREVTVETGSPVELTWEWDLERSGNLPPGAEIWWQWELETADGTQTVTPVQTLTIEDTRYAWQKIERSGVSLYWVEGDWAFADRLLTLSIDSMERLSENVGLEPDENIRIMVYPDAEGVQKAVVYSTEWVGGMAFPEYNVVLAGIAPEDTDWAEEIIPHELAHLVTGMRVFNCQGSDLPTWLGEGLAEYASGPAPESVKTSIHEALETGKLPPLNSLSNGFAADTRKANQAYDQSRLVVTFLLEQYGAEKLDALLDQYRGGTSFEVAMRAVYGLDTSELDQTWRASLGFGSAPTPNFATATAPVKPTAVATLRLYSPLTTATTELTQTLTPAPTLTPQATLPATETAVVNHDAGPEPAPGLPLWLSGGALVLGCAAVGLFLRTRRQKQP